MKKWNYIAAALAGLLMLGGIVAAATGVVPIGGSEEVNQVIGTEIPTEADESK
jgi:hypothetical protein